MAPFAYVWPLMLSVVLAVTAVPACDGLTGAPEPPPPPQTLEAAQARWNAAGPDAYCFRFERSCFCSPAHVSATAIVRADTVAALRDVRANGVPIEATDYAFERTMAKSIEQLFGLLCQAEHGMIDSVSVAYDAEQGYPSTLFVDPLQAMADEEITYSVQHVRPLAAPDETDCTP